MLDRARVPRQSLRVLPSLEGQVRALALLGAGRLHALALRGALLDVLGHRVEGALVLHGGGLVGVAEKLLVRILLKQIPSLVVVGKGARAVGLAELEPLLATRLAEVVLLLELL